MGRFFKLFAAFVLPVMALDGCLNRDPAFFLDENHELAATSGDAPLSLIRHGTQHDFQLHDITEFRMNESVFTGLTGEWHFIVDRRSGNHWLQATQSQRDLALQSQFGVTASDLSPKRWYSAALANPFFPYNYVYYILATSVFAAVTLFGCGDTARTEQDVAANP